MAARTLESDGESDSPSEQEDLGPGEVDQENKSDDDCSSDDDEVPAVRDDVPASLMSLYQKIQALQWKFQPVETKTGFHLIDDRKSWTNARDGLKRRVSQTFSNPFNCFFAVSGVSYESVARLARNSNHYFDKMIKPRLNNRNNRYHHLAWKPITTQEMFRFLGIMLKISLQPMDAGGYKAYFSGNNIFVDPGGKVDVLEIEGTRHIVSKYMTLNRFMQIRGAFHPEDKSASMGGDKCYQLRYAINAFNDAAFRTFIVPIDISFDEGGCGCRSRYCPCRQYNKDKPKKYRVDFFICSSAKKYNILHLDVYQGKNSNNVGISNELQCFPVTQKAVLNALHQLNLHMETDGFRFVATDNQYACPELAVACRERFNCYLSGTCRTNRVGWMKEMMDLSKKSDRGACKLLYNKENKVIIGQWNDNKVVNFVSTLNDCGLGTVKRQVGSNKIELPCPNALIAYQQKMGGVDKGDQMRGHMAGFSNKVHFKKWYKRVYLAILDCGLLNAFVAWNMSAEDRATGRNVLSRHAFYHYVAKEMCHYIDPTTEEKEGSVIPPIQATRPSIEGHNQIRSKPETKCSVCILKWKWREELPKDQQDRIQGKGHKTNVALCEMCGVKAHSIVVSPERRNLIHTREQFKGNDML